MSNMQDFIRWRGDLPFSAVPVGEVDGLILAQLAMYRWEMALPEGGDVRVQGFLPALQVLGLLEQRVKALGRSDEGAGDPKQPPDHRDVHQPSHCARLSFLSGIPSGAAGGSPRGD